MSAGSGCSANHSSFRQLFCHHYAEGQRYSPKLATAISEVALSE